MRRTLDHHPPLSVVRKPATTAVTDALWRRYQCDRDMEARARLLEQYLGLVHHAARELATRLPGAMQFEDLLSAGTVGLVQALESFDPARGFAFSSFALPRIRGAMRDEMRSWDWIPRSVRERIRHLRSVESDLRRRLGRQPEPDEMAAALGVDLATYWRYADANSEPVLLPLDPAPAGRAPERRLAEAIADPASRSQSDALEADETWSELAIAFATLSERDRLILNLSYFEELTLREIGEILHITESRVSQIRTRALRRLGERIDPRREAA